MAGESEVRRAVTTLDALGYPSTQLTFNAESDWLSLSWLTVVGDGRPDSIRAIVKTVLGVDPRAIRI